MPPGVAAGERHLCLDRGYGYAACREAATARPYTPHIPTKASVARPRPPSADPTRHRPRCWVVEAAHPWCNRFRRLHVRWEKKATNCHPIVHLAANLIVCRRLLHARSLPG